MTVISGRRHDIVPNYRNPTRRRYWVKNYAVFSCAFTGSIRRANYSLRSIRSQLRDVLSAGSPALHPVNGRSRLRKEVCLVENALKILRPSCLNIPLKGNAISAQPDSILRGTVRVRHNRIELLLPLYLSYHFAFCFAVGSRSIPISKSLLYKEKVGQLPSRRVKQIPRHGERIRGITDCHCCDWIHIHFIYKADWIDTRATGVRAIRAIY